MDLFVGLFLYPLEASENLWWKPLVFWRFHGVYKWNIGLMRLKDLIQDLILWKGFYYTNFNAITCLKLTIETLEQGVKYVQS